MLLRMQMRSDWKLVLIYFATALHGNGEPFFSFVFWRREMPCSRIRLQGGLMGMEYGEKSTGFYG